MNTPQKIYVAGHRGVVGSAIVRDLLQPAPLFEQRPRRECPRPRAQNT